jgi:outer membrane biosynthesis protein TonB
MVIERAWIPAVAVFASGLAHVLGWLSVGEQVSAAARRMPPASIVDFSMPPPPPAPVLAEPPPAPSPPEPAAPRPAPPKPTAAPKPAPETPPPAAALSGVTLTGQGPDATWASPIGNGETMTAPLPAIGSGPPSTVEARPDPSAPAPHEPILVPVRNLSAKPRPPTLDDLLQHNYPADARRRGLGGSAVVAARIEPDGVVRAVRVLTANDGDGDGFGEACRRTLLGSRWSAPLDTSGRAVFTEIRYTCRFQVMP